MTCNRRVNRLTIERWTRDCLDVRFLKRTGILDGSWVTIGPSLRWPRIARMRIARYLLILDLRGHGVPQHIRVSRRRTRAYLRTTMLERHRKVMAEAFAAIAKTLPLGTFEPAPNANGERNYAAVFNVDTSIVLEEPPMKIASFNINDINRRLTNRTANGPGSTASTGSTAKRASRCASGGRGGAQWERGRQSSSRRPPTPAGLWILSTTSWPVDGDFGSSTSSTT